ncbi:MAG TPA: DUF4142 domain-containing protein [Gemmatimonadaceae bacterium]
MKRLNGLSGAEFDKTFLQNEVGYHDAVIGAVTKTPLPAIQNAELKDLVTKVAAAFVAHRIPPRICSISKACSRPADHRPAALVGPPPPKRATRASLLGSYRRVALWLHGNFCRIS